MYANSCMWDCKLLHCMQGNDFCERFASRWDFRGLWIYFYGELERKSEMIYTRRSVMRQLNCFTASHSWQFIIHIQKGIHSKFVVLYNKDSVQMYVYSINTVFGFACLCLRVCLHGRWCHWICIVGFGRGLEWYKTIELSN